MNKQNFKTVYLSGPMTGYPEYNYPAFNELEQLIKQLDPTITVINPTQTGVQEGWSWQDYLTHDLKLLLDGKPDAIITLPDWERSRGAKLEVHVAKELGILTYPSKRFLQELRGNIFERPTALYRKHDFSIYAIREYDEAVRELDHLRYEHDQARESIEDTKKLLEAQGHDSEELKLEQYLMDFPLELIELPIDLPVQGLILNVPTDFEPVDLPKWIQKQINQ